MNKDEMQNKIEQLEKEINKLKESLSRSKEPDRWKGYTIGYHRPWNNAKHSYFRTQALGELREKQIDAENELFNIWEHLVGNWRPNNKDQSWHVVWNDYENVPISFADSQPGEITIYKLFPTSELAMKQYELASDHAQAYMRGEF